MSSLLDDINAKDDFFRPILYWGQDRKYTYLKIQLSEVTQPKIEIFSETVNFFTQAGNGAQGRHPYSFSLQLYLPIKPEESKYQVKENFIEIVLRKEYLEAWPRLTLPHIKLPWVKINFDRFLVDFSDEEGDGDENNITNGFKDNKLKGMEELDKMIDEDEQLWNFIKNPLNIYLIVFNLFQFAGYLFVFCTLLWTVIHRGAEGRTSVYARVVDQLLVVQLASILEIFHAALKWVKSSTMTTIMQVFGRNLVLIGVLIPTEQLHNLEPVYWLFFAWSAIEIVRYPYYLLKVFDKENSLLTYLRYTLWIPLYPMGFICEGILILRMLPIAAETKVWSLGLPNAANVSFDFSIFLHIYLILFMFGFYTVMNHMLRRRRAKLTPKRNARRPMKGFFREMFSGLIPWPHWAEKSKEKPIVINSDKQERQRLASCEKYSSNPSLTEVVDDHQSRLKVH